MAHYQQEQKKNGGRDSIISPAHGCLVLLVYQLECMSLCGFVFLVNVCVFTRVYECVFLFLGVALLAEDIDPDR